LACGAESETAAASAVAARFLLCSPQHFGVDTERNPWRASRFVAQRHLALAEWSELQAVLAGRLGARVETIAPSPALPGMVFAANAALVIDGRVFLSRFRHEARRGESERFAAWFETRGYTLEHLPDGLFFEGEGEMLAMDDRLWAGCHDAGGVESHRWIARRLGAPVVSLRLVDHRFGHLDTCFCPLAPGLAAYHPEAFDQPSRRLLQRLVPRLIEVPRGEALRFACNSIVVGDDVIVPAGCERTRSRLEAEGFSVWPLSLHQFRLESGGPKCLALRLAA
jgi:N-dimethylarginine dimethylaminohydrolase